MFRVPWQDDRGEIHVNRGFRIEMSSCIGPYKGGLRFHPSVNLGILKFWPSSRSSRIRSPPSPWAAAGGLGFRSQGQERQRGHAVLPELHDRARPPHRPEHYVPAGDIGVGGREIGYLFGQYKRLRNEFTGVLTGKGINWGGSLIRPEATGYGCVYFAQEMLATRGQTLAGKTCLVSGSGNVAQYTIEKLLDLGARPVTASDSNGYIYDEAGMDRDKLAFLMDLKNVRRGRIKEYSDKYSTAITPAGSEQDSNPLWDHKADCAFPSATQTRSRRRRHEPPAQRRLPGGRGREHAFLVEAGNSLWTQRPFRPGKAANAGGVATSGLEMCRTACATVGLARRGREAPPHQKDIHKACVETAERSGHPEIT